VDLVIKARNDVAPSNDNIGYLKENFNIHRRSLHSLSLPTLPFLPLPYSHLLSRLLSPSLSYLSSPPLPSPTSPPSLLPAPCTPSLPLEVIPTKGLRERCYICFPSVVLGKDPAEIDFGAF